MSVLKDIQTFLETSNEGPESLETMAAHLQELRAMLDKKKALIQQGQDYITNARSGLAHDIAIVDEMNNCIERKAKIMVLTDISLETLRDLVAQDRTIMQTWLRAVGYFHPAQTQEPGLGSGAEAVEKRDGGDKVVEDDEDDEDNDGLRVFLAEDGFGVGVGVEEEEEEEEAENENENRDDAKEEQDGLDVSADAADSGSEPAPQGLVTARVGRGATDGDCSVQ